MIRRHYYAAAMFDFAAGSKVHAPSASADEQRYRASAIRLPRGAALYDIGAPGARDHMMARRRHHTPKGSVASPLHRLFRFCALFLFLPVRCFIFIV